MSLARNVSVYLLREPGFGFMCFTLSLSVFSFTGFCRHLHYSFPPSFGLFLFSFSGFLNWKLIIVMGCPGGSDGRESACSAGDPGSVPGSGRSPREGNGNPLWYFCLENPMDGGAWWATVHGVAKSQRRLSDFSFFLSFFLSLYIRDGNNNTRIQDLW